MSDDKANTDKYQGTGGIISGFGRGTGEGLLAATAGKLLDTVFKTKPIEFRSGSVGRIAITLGTIAAIHGSFKGVQSASKGKDQFDALKTDIKNKDTIIAALSAGAPAQGKGR